MKHCICIVIALLLTGCGSNPNRAGCSYVDGTGKGNYGVPYIQGLSAEGNVKGAHIYMGDEIKKLVEITCNADVQEVKTR